MRTRACVRRWTWTSTTASATSTTRSSSHPSRPLRSGRRRAASGTPSPPTASRVHRFFWDAHILFVLEELVEDCERLCLVFAAAVICVFLLCCVHSLVIVALLMSACLRLTSMFSVKIHAEEFLGCYVGVSALYQILRSKFAKSRRNTFMSLVFMEVHVVCFAYALSVQAMAGAPATHLCIPTSWSTATAFGWAQCG